MASCVERVNECECMMAWHPIQGVYWNSTRSLNRLQIQSDEALTKKNNQWRGFTYSLSVISDSSWGGFRINPRNTGNKDTPYIWCQSCLIQAHIHTFIHSQEWFTSAKQPTGTFFETWKETHTLALTWAHDWTLGFNLIAEICSVATLHSDAVMLWWAWLYRFLLQHILF